MLRKAKNVTDLQFRQIGRGYHIFRDTAHGLCILCSALGLMQWPARNLSTRYAPYRISLYSERNAELIGLCDAARYPVNDVAFHPEQPLVAIACGMYDGGYFFEGELILWNWQTGRAVSVLPEEREVTHCRFMQDGELLCLVRPAFEDDEVDSFSAYHSIRFDWARALVPNESTREWLKDLLERAPSVGVKGSGFAEHRLEQWPSHQEFAQQLNALLSVEFEPRHFAWDVCWLDQRYCALVHQDCLLEVWDTRSNTCTRHFGQGYGIQVFKLPTERVFVHELIRGWSNTGPVNRSALHILENNGLRQLRIFDRVYLFSSSRDGLLLARDIDYSKKGSNRKDLILDHECNVLRETNFGHYDLFNHHVCIHGTSDLYFLRGTPADQHEKKVLCAATLSGPARDVLVWDRQNQHYMDAIAIVVQPDILVRAYKVYDPQEKGPTIIDAYSISKQALLWKREVATTVSAICSLVGRDMVAVALTSCELQLVDLRNGEICERQKVECNEIPTIVTAMSWNKEERLLATGTIDAQLLIFQF